MFFHTDCHVDIDGLRKVLDRILTYHPCWDRREKKVLVYDPPDKGAVLRLTGIATDGSRLWDLLCDVREKLLAYVQQSPEQLAEWRVEPLASLSVPV